MEYPGQPRPMPHQLIAQSPMKKLHPTSWAQEIATSRAVLSPPTVVGLRRPPRRMYTKGQGSLNGMESEAMSLGN